MHPFPGSVLSPLLSPPSSECTPSSKGSVSDLLTDRQEQYKSGGHNYPLSPMSNSTPPLPYRSSYPATSTSNGIVRSPPKSYPPPGAAGPRHAIPTEGANIRGSSPPRGPSLLPPVTPSPYRSRQEFTSPTQRPDSQSSYFSHHSPAQQPFSPPPQPPKRAKAHVPSACVNCKNAHLACDVQRPCPRCVSTGKQDSCVDVEHKKRGRPRLRDVRHSFEISRAIDSRSGLNLEGRPPSPGALNGRGLRLPGPERVGRTSISSRASPYALADPTRQDHASRSMFVEPMHAPRSQSFDAASYTPPTAFLTTDLVVASSTASFQDLLGFAAHDLNLRRTVYDLATDSPADLKNLDRVLRCIRAIIQQEDSHYRTPPSQEVYNVLQRSSPSDLRASLQAGPVIEEFFDFRRSDSAVIKGFARFYLSRASVYFVAMEVTIVRNRSYTGPSTSRAPEAQNFPPIPHRNSADNIQNQLPPHRRSFPSPNFSNSLKPLQPSPAVPQLPRGMNTHTPTPGSSTYPPVPVPTHRRDHSMELKHPQALSGVGSASSLKQYSVSSGPYTPSLDTRNSPRSIISPSVGSIYASPTELTPRTEHIQLPPLRGISSIPNIQDNRRRDGEHGNPGLGIQLNPEVKVERAPETTVTSRRGAIGLKEIVE